LASGATLAYGVVLVLVLVALDPWSWGLPPLLALAGMEVTVTGTSANALLEATAAPHLLGRTVSLS
jgi:hypothetical protein